MKYVIFFIFILCSPAFALGQDDVDTWRNEITDNIKCGKYEDALNLIEKCIDFCEKNDAEKSTIASYNMPKGVCFYALAKKYASENNFQKAYSIGTQALVCFKNINNEDNVYSANVLNDLAGYKNKLGDIDSAIVLTNQSLCLYERLQGKNMKIMPL